jgi:hypothetical protein
MLNIVTLREMIWRPLGMDDENDPDLGIARADLYLNRAYWEIQDKFPFREKEKNATFSTIAGVRDYDMPEPIEALQSLSIVDPNSGKHIELNQITTGVYEDTYQEGEDYYEFPVDYTLIGCYARLLPTPKDVYKMVVKRLVVLADITNLNATPPIPQVWHEIIGYGGLWRAFIDFGDFSRAQQIKAHANALINSLTPREAKEERANTQTAGLEVIRNEYQV